ncbi:TPA: acyl-protein synthetase [Patescibacteria group bacterium]|nr:MAG: Acyl-protein synthetase-related protein [Candidatus Woesebacteria bacterium GW2011_GWC1_42_9]HCI05308.1 acyl-protein synthetase [Patescibacteria group bacterium]
MLIDEKPFSLLQAEKDKLFKEAIAEAAQWHYEQNAECRRLYDSQDFDPNKDFELEDLPYFPVSVFKKFDLLSVPQEDIVKTLFSSSTTGLPSKIFIDNKTAEMQAKAIRQILIDFLGSARRTFIIFDSPNIVKSIGGNLNSRGTAIRGILPFAREVFFILDDDLNLNLESLRGIEKSLETNDSLCFFGFTWLLFSIYTKNKDNRLVREVFKNIADREKILLHIGGWKKLSDVAVSKADFNAAMGDFLSLNQHDVIDMYGMTEQLGTIYPDCSRGYKHVSLYSEIIIRDPKTLGSVVDGKIGIIELLSFIPHSYPGIALLSEDLGRVVGVDDCLCGRKGKYFVFEKRSEEAELRGCGDALAI